MSPIIARHKKPLTPQLANALELGRAGKAAKLVEWAFDQQLQDIQDSTQSKRLLTRLKEVLETDTTHPRGQRTVSAGQLALLEGFDFCLRKSLHSALPLEPEVQIDRQRGYCSVHFPVFCPGEVIRTRMPVTHIRVCAVAAEIDFDHEYLVTHTYTSVPLSLDVLTPLHLFPYIPAGSRHTVIVAVGIRLLQVFNGTPYEMKEGGKVALQIVKVDVGPQTPDVLNEELPNGQQGPVPPSRMCKVVPLHSQPAKEPNEKTLSKKKSNGRKAAPK